jgi:periplasmic copper chaperone A
MIAMKKWLFALVLGGFFAPTWAQAPGVKVEDAWVRATVAQQKTTGAFMRLTADKNAKLVGVLSAVAGVAEIHEMAMENDVMRMRAVGSVALPAGKTTELKPGGYHLMLMDLKQPVKVGDAVPLTLVFEDAAQKRSTLELKLPVRALGGASMGKSEAMKHDMSSHGHDEAGHGGHKH